MSISEELSDAVATPRRVKLLTPSKVAADIKKVTGAKAGMFRPRLGIKQMGVNATKLNPYTVMVAPEMSAGTNDEEAAHWDAVLDALLAQGYTLVADALSSDRIIGGPAALAKAKATRIVAVQKTVT